jgi:hypothetical protein
MLDAKVSWLASGKEFKKKCLRMHYMVLDGVMVHDPFIYLEHSCDIAGAEDPLHAGVSLGIRCREVGSEDAVLGALPALVLARGAPLALAAGGGFRVCARRHDLAQDFAEGEKICKDFAEGGREDFLGDFEDLAKICWLSMYSMG